jgi:hypothetical protein
LFCFFAIYPGKSGQVVHLMTNYIPVGRKSNDVVVQYQVAYDPTNLTVPQKCRLIHEWAKNSVKLDISDYTFDRNSLIYVGPKGFAILKEVRPLILLSREALFSSCSEFTQISSIHAR